MTTRVTRSVAAVATTLLVSVLAGVSSQPLAATAGERAQTPHARLCADNTTGQVTVDVLGDSVAAGYGIPGSRTWASQLSRQLNAPVWSGAVSGSVVGDYLPGGQYRFHTDFAKAVHPTVTVMNWRINDQWLSFGNPGNYNPTAFAARYRAVLTELRAATPSSTLVIAVSPWTLDTRIDAGTYKQQDYINALWDLKVEFNALWLDWTKFFPKAGENDTAGLLIYDLVHPSEAGQAVMGAQAFERLIAPCVA